MRTAVLVMAAMLSGLLLGQWTARAPLARAESAAAPANAELQAQVEQLQRDVKKLNEAVPDQAAVMSHLAYHFTNLWFAADQENWPLADFYLSETRANLRWAVRIRPVRKDLQGKETVQLLPIAEALDNGPFTQLKNAIAAQDKKSFMKLYNETLTGCYACHKASFKPYLRPQVPTAPEARVVNFDPKATTPQ